MSTQRNLYIGRFTRPILSTQKVVFVVNGAVLVTDSIRCIKDEVENGKSVLDKEITSYDDVFDAFRAAM